MDQLTPREREVLALVDRGLTNDEIAERLSISLSGVKHHVSQIISKAGVNRRYEAGPSLGRNWLGLGGRFALAATSTAVVAAVVVLGIAVLMDSNNDEEPSVDSAASATATFASTASATARPTGQFTQQELAGLMAQPGLPEFLAEMQRAVNANDAQWLIDSTRFEPYDCANAGGLPASPEECFGPTAASTIPAISLGAWQSDGGYISQASYEEYIRQRLTGEFAQNARMYAIGQVASRVVCKLEKGLTLPVAVQVA